MSILEQMRNLPKVMKAISEMPPEETTIPADVAGFMFKDVPENDWLFPTYAIPAKDAERCERFAVEVADTCHYPETRRDKKIHQEYYSKMGELLVVHAGLEVGLPLVPPDFIVREGADKRWHADSNLKYCSLEIKTCEDFTDTSWLVSKWDGKTPDVGEKTDKKFFPVPAPNLYVAFVVIDVPSRTGRLLTVVHAPLLSNLFSDAKYPSQNAIKRAIYLGHLYRNGYIGGFEEMVVAEAEYDEQIRGNLELVSKLKGRVKR